MRKLTQFITLIVVLALFAVPVFSDTLVLKTGERISGYFEGGSARIVKFRTSDGVVKDYDILSVKQIQFEDEKRAASFTTTTQAENSAHVPTTRLLQGRVSETN